MAHMLADQPPRPANMLNIVAINQGRRPLTMEEPRALRLAAAQAHDAVRRGELPLDARPPEAFAAGHIAGALSVSLASSEFEQRAGWMLPPEGSVILITEGEEAAQDAVRKLAFVGLDQRVRHCVIMQDWLDAGLPVTSLPQMSVTELSERMGREGLRVLDVREASEWRQGHLAQAVHMSFKQLPARLEELRLSRQGPLAVVCGTGMRSSTASSYLLRNGYENLFNVVGGMTAWNKAGLPVTK